MTKIPSPHKGVNWDVKAKAWRARLYRDNNVIALGFHLKLEDAIAARLEGEANNPRIKNVQPWTREDERELRELRAAGHTYTEIGKRLGRTREVCRQKFNRPDGESYRRRPWTDADVKLLQEQVGVMPRLELCALLRRSEAAVNNKLKSLGGLWAINHVAEEGVCPFPISLYPVKRCRKTASGAYCDFHTKLMQG